MSESKLIIKIDNKRPIELTDFTDSFNSLGEEYYKFLSESNHFSLSSETKLYIKEIKSCCIITELTDLVPLVLPFIENTNSVIEFTKFLKNSFEYFLGKTEQKPKEFDLKDCNNFNNIIKPIAKDNGSNVIYTGECQVANITINMNFNSIEANAIQNGIIKEKEKLKEPEKKTEKKVLFYWDTAKYDEKSKSMDRGFIDSIYKNPLKVVCEELIKSQMLNTKENPFHLAYIVDVEILEIKNIPIVYKIIAVYDSFLK
jgi:hypothetical protein